MRNLLRYSAGGPYLALSRSHLFGTLFAACLVTLALTTLACNRSGPASQTIGSEGGTMQTRDGVVALEIPPGALSSNTRITITKVDPKDWPEELAEIKDEVVGDVYRLEPTGLTFAQPITITRRIDPRASGIDLDEGVPVVMLANRSDHGEWSLLEDMRVRVEDGHIAVSGTAAHFSTNTAFGGTVTLSMEPAQVRARVGDTFAVQAVLRGSERLGASLMFRLSTFLGDERVVRARDASPPTISDGAEEFVPRTLSDLSLAPGSRVSWTLNFHCETAGQGWTWALVLLAGPQRGLLNVAALFREAPSVVQIEGLGAAECTDDDPVVSVIEGLDHIVVLDGPGRIVDACVSALKDGHVGLHVKIESATGEPSAEPPRVELRGPDGEGAALPPPSSYHLRSGWVAVGPLSPDDRDGGAEYLSSLGERWVTQHPDAFGVPFPGGACVEPPVVDDSDGLWSAAIPDGFDGMLRFVDERGDPVSVLVINSEHWPVDQFHIAAPDACAAEHYHAAGPVYSLEGSTMTDPNPRGCGFGSVGEVPVEDFTPSEEQLERYQNRRR